MPTALIVGSGPNGLAAGIELARNGVEVTVAEAADTIGGGMRSGEYTLPGLIHDHCAAIVPTAVSSPFMRSLDLAAHGVQWAWPEIDLAHPLDGGQAAVLTRSLADTARGFGVDGPRWQALMEPLVADYDTIAGDLLGPLVRIPDHPVKMARFGVAALAPASTFARLFATPQVRALFAGNAAHAWTPLTRPPSNGVALMFAVVAHRYGWPVVVGGTSKLADGLAGLLRSLGGRIEVGTPIVTHDQTRDFDLVMYDTGPRSVVGILGDELPQRIRRAYERYRYGAAAFKLDIAVHDGIPWSNENVRKAGTVHVCGGYAEVAYAEKETFHGLMPQRPFMIVGQQAVADPSRTTGGLVPIYAYAHVPRGYPGDPSALMLDQIERFAPGFRDRIEVVRAHGPADLLNANANFIDGDINGGSMDFRQFVGRPRLAVNPYRTGVDGHYLCSSSTPPGGGLHGMCGYHAARSALDYLARQHRHI
ncbi:NAD(P)/FAD-dependent oxidoreductase [Gordonia sp. TBRC 11910]|uniref:NAD(P)/FAD-dependent oxidoreductase n=1 Tax=Gordonia asplenii TaxID=2725283 RepID=A0A848L9Y0_9ACTN|nr:NAD(P)/FAD-dependent oxidoreductase [Gordonia asplenii]NMO05261.1 NAD(P)/FAD-dependent oxidoreductase [Gordonia asplenii]